jgi:hypothetical protein
LKKKRDKLLIGFFVFNLFFFFPFFSFLFLIQYFTYWCFKNCALYSALFFSFFLFVIQLQNAQDFGAVGMVLYSDPADYNIDDNVNNTYPNSWWLPPSGIQRGTVGSDGDPDTPLYPSTCEFQNSTEISFHYL